MELGDPSDTMRPGTQVGEQASPHLVTAEPRRTQPAAASAWLVRFTERPDARLRLCCFPYAGGGTAPFHAWASRLPAWIDLLVVRLPGRESRLREQPFTDLPSLVAALLPVLAPVAKQPLVFFGHSLGALLAFECARALQRAHGLTLAHLVVSGRRAPQLASRIPPSLAPGMSDDEMIDGLRGLQGTPEALLRDRDAMRIFLPTLRADLQMAARYAYEPGDRLACGLTALAGREDAEVNTEELAAWGAHTTGRFESHVVPGGHFYLHAEQARVLLMLERTLAPRAPPTARTDHVPHPMV